MIKPGEKSFFFNETAEERARTLLQVAYEFLYRDHYQLGKYDNLFDDELFYDDTDNSGLSFMTDIENWFREFYDREIEEEMEHKYYHNDEDEDDEE